VCCALVAEKSLFFRKHNRKTWCVQHRFLLGYRKSKPFHVDISQIHTYYVYRSCLHISPPCEYALFQAEMTYGALENNNYTCEPSASPIPLISSVLGAAELLILIALFVYVKRQRYLASLGSRKASLVLVLPIYHYVLNYTIFAGILVAVDNILSIFYGYLLLFWIKYFLYRLCAEALSIFLMHNGVGERALKRSILFSLILTLSFLGLQIVFFSLFGYDGYFFTLISQFALITLAYSILWWAPVAYIHRRPAAIRYARYYTLTCSVVFTALCLIIVNNYWQCAAQLILSIIDFIQPFIIIRALSEDSKFWSAFNIIYP